MARSDRLSRRDALASSAYAVGAIALGAPHAFDHQLHASRPEPRFERLFELQGNLEKPQEVGATPTGVRRIFLVTGGSFEGPAARGTVLPGGGDWLVRRPDGVSELDVRVTLRTDDDQLIYARYRGLIDIPPPVQERRGRGERIDPSEYYFRTTPVFETASAKYAWLNRIIAVGVGEIGVDRVAYTVYAVR